MASVAFIRVGAEHGSAFIATFHGQSAGGCMRRYRPVWRKLDGAGFQKRLAESTADIVTWAKSWPSGVWRIPSVAREGMQLNVS